MIRIVRGDEWRDSGAGALLRSVSDRLEPITPLERRLEEEGGDEVRRRLRELGELPLGGAVVTPGGGLPVPLVIHVVIRSAVAPVSEAGVVRALQNGLRQAAEWGVEVVAMPPLGTGAGNLDAEAAAQALHEAFRRHRLESLLPREVVLFVGGDYEADAFGRVAGWFVPPES